jgi:diguanylate cyclase (GGDEF)-like protein/PAS domain S-box-containing protein
VLTSAYQIYDDYLRDLSEVDVKLQQLEKTLLPTISLRLWNFDEQGLAIAVESIFALDLIRHIEIVDDERKVISMGSATEKSTIRREYPLYHTIRGVQQRVGTVIVLASLDQVYQHVFDQGLVIIISNAIKTFIVSGIILLLFFQVIARHLNTIGDFAKGFQFKNLGNKLSLQRKKSLPDERDELDFLVDAIDTMQERIKLAVDAELSAQEAIQSKRYSENRFRSYAEASSDWFWEMDPSGKFTYLSERFFKLTNIKPADIYGFGEDLLVNPAVENFDSKKWLSHNKQVKLRAPFRNFEYAILTDGGALYVSINGNPEFNQDGVFIGYRGTGSEITERKAAEKALRFEASHDNLTGLINRQEFEMRASRLLVSYKSGNAEHAMCFLDLDQFKVINDTCGHGAGDELLRSVAELMRSHIRNRDTLARIGGDEFGLLMEHCPFEQAYRLAETLLRAVQDYHFFWKGKAFRIGVSIGLVTFSDTTDSYTELFRQADAACYLAKDLGRNRIHTFCQDDSELTYAHGQMQWVGRINQALEEDRFLLYLQPIVPISAMGSGSELMHYEVLIRLQEEQGDIAQPQSFLPAAERFGLANKLDTWVVKNVCRFLVKQPLFIEQIDFVSINLSGASLTNEDFLGLVMTSFKSAGLPLEKICFEITETAAISNIKAAASFIMALKKQGCRFALDDFGTGSSSFGYLKYLPVDYLKIDGMFVKDIVENRFDWAMVKSINEIAHVMGMKTIAEYVENDEIRAVLSDIGVDYAQGYFFGEPEPVGPDGKQIDEHQKGQSLQAVN